MDTGLITIERTAMIPTRISRQITPVLFSGSNKAERRFWEFFTATIRNPNTRMAYLTAAYRFYIEDTDLESKSTFILLRQLFDLQAGQSKPQVPALTLPVR